MVLGGSMPEPGLRRDDPLRRGSSSSGEGSRSHHTRVDVPSLRNNGGFRSRSNLPHSGKRRTVKAMNINDPIYSDENKAREHLEKLSWPHGPFCPHCGNTDPARLTKLKGKSTRPGVYKCKECRKPFSVTVGTVMERSKIPLGKWLLAMHLMTSSKKGMSAHQLHRMLGMTYEAAWFMAHRLREAMKPDSPAARSAAKARPFPLTRPTS